MSSSSIVSRTLRIGLIAAGLALTATPVLAQKKPATPPAPAAAAANPADPVLAKGNGFTITESDLKQFAASLGADEDSVKDPQKRPMLIEYLVSIKAVAAAAQAAKVDQSADFAEKLDDLKQQLLVQTYLEQEVKKAVTPEALKKAYDTAVAKMQPTPEVRARHILISIPEASTEAGKAAAEAKSLEEAKAVVARLRKGEDFAKVAAEVSKDPGSKDNGGELGFFSKDRMVAPFADAAFKLDVNQISDPVKTDFGWHIIQVEEKRNRPVPTFDEMKPKLEEVLNQHAQQAAIDQAKKAANVEILEKAADEAPSATPAAPAAPAKK